MQFHIVASEKPDVVIAKYIRDRGEGLHHIAFRVVNLEQLIVRLKRKGVRLVPFCVATACPSSTCPDIVLLD